jgi:hypothetical protein
MYTTSLYVPKSPNIPFSNSGTPESWLSIVCARSLGAARIDDLPELFGPRITVIGRRSIACSSKALKFFITNLDSVIIAIPFGAKFDTVGCITAGRPAVSSSQHLQTA